MHLQSETDAFPFSRKDMLKCMYACDSAANGLFITGVLTTGIYCLPSCPARKPKAGNVVFFRTERAALEAGLRACRRCRPDDYYARRDPERESFTVLIEMLERAPLTFTSVVDLAEQQGIGTTKLYDIVERYAGTTPGELIHKYRIAHAAKLLTYHNMSVIEAAFESGYASLSAFYDRFKQFTGQTPGKYRKSAVQETGEVLGCLSRKA